MVVGDGPAGTAVAAAIARTGMNALLIGRGEAWEATYGVWADELSALTALGIAEPHEVIATSASDVTVVTTRSLRLERAYTTLDNVRLRERLLAPVAAVIGEVTAIREHLDRVELSTTLGTIAARRVVVAAGAGAGPPLGAGQRRGGAWQTAYGVVLDSVPESDHLVPGRTVLMDLSDAAGSVGDGIGVPSFCYVVQTVRGWLVEETVLTAAPAVDPLALRARLIARLGDPALVIDAERRGAVEQVRIAMDAPARAMTSRVVPYGAAAAMIHPATGYSIAAALRRAPIVAEALLADEPPGSAIWPRTMRATRALHRYGARALEQLDAAHLRAFFDVFFDRPVEDWASYLQIDAPPTRVARVMAEVFRDAPRSVRYRLLTAGWGGRRIE